MSEERTLARRQALVTPRAAAIAGIIFALLMGTSYWLTTNALPLDQAPTPETLQDQERTISLALELVPFAGIAFLWFMGVVRDRLGNLEDQFFSTLFVGSGLLYLAMTFAAAAMTSGLMSLVRTAPELVTDGTAYHISRVSIFHLNRIFAMRMAGMHMLVAGTIWIRTGVIHRWLVIITYILALLMIFGLGYLSWFTLVFPAWVFVISIYILIWNYRQTKAVSDPASEAV